jgi:hypothetical protein
VEENDGAAESACKVLGEDCVEEDVELLGDTIVPKPELLFDLDGVFEYDGCVTNFGCE